jgi:hypothetical protein
MTNRACPLREKSGECSHTLCVRWGCDLKVPALRTNYFGRQLAIFVGECRHWAPQQSDQQIRRIPPISMIA